MDTDVECFRTASYSSPVRDEPMSCSHWDVVWVVLSGRDGLSNLHIAETEPHLVAAFLRWKSRTLLEPSVILFDVRFLRIDLSCKCCKKAESFKPNCIFNSENSMILLSFTTCPRGTISWCCHAVFDMVASPASKRRFFHTGQDGKDTLLISARLCTAFTISQEKSVSGL